MIDIKALRANPDEYKTGLARRGVGPEVIDALLANDEQRRELMTKEQALRAESSAFSKTIGKASPEERPALIEQNRALSDQVEALKAQVAEYEAKQRELLDGIPNLAHPDVPDGGEDDAVQLFTFGSKPEFVFEVKDHVALGTALGILDIERAVKVAGSRFAFLLGDAVWLEFALVNYAMGVIEGYGHTPAIPPVLSRAESLYGSGFLPGGREQIYHIGEDDLYLVGTAEAPLAGMFADEILDPAQLPLRMGGFSTCFRREAGTYGKDLGGLFRVHQFDKVEMFSWVLPEHSWDEHVRFRDIQVEILENLGLHGQVVDIAVGDLGDPAARKYDLECWLPGQQRYRELTSTSNCTDYQARRLGIRYRKEDGGTETLHTLNGTACAVGRTIIAILETHQRADGTVVLPEPIAQRMGKEVLTPVK